MSTFDRPRGTRAAVVAWILLLRRAHYHLYFVVEADRVFVVAVWSAFRGRGPRL